MTITLRVIRERFSIVVITRVSTFLTLATHASKSTARRTHRRQSGRHGTTTTKVGSPRPHPSPRPSPLPHPLSRRRPMPQMAAAATTAATTTAKTTAMSPTILKVLASIRPTATRRFSLGTFAVGVSSRTRRPLSRVLKSVQTRCFSRSVLTK